MPRFTDSSTGGLILQAAQSLVQLNQQRKQLELRQKQFEENRKLQEEKLKLQQDAAKAKEEFNEIQLGFLQQKAAAQPAQAAQAEAELRATTALAEKREAETLEILRGGPAKLQSLSEAKLRLLMQPALTDAAERHGVPLTAGDNLKSLREEMHRLERKLAAAEDPTAAALAGISQALGGPAPQAQDTETDRTRLEALRRLLSDEQLLQRQARVINGFVDQQEGAAATGQALREQGIPTPTGPELNAINNEIDAFRAQSDARLAGSTLFQGSSDEVVRGFVEEFQRNPSPAGATQFAQFLERKVLQGSPPSDETLSKVMDELKRLGLDDQTILQLMGATTTLLSNPQ